MASLGGLGGWLTPGISQDSRHIGLLMLLKALEEKAMNPDPASRKSEDRTPASGEVNPLNAPLSADPASKTTEIVLGARTEESTATQNQERKVEEVLGGGKAGKFVATELAADSSVDSDFEKGKRTVNSAAYQGIWRGTFAKDLFDFEALSSKPEVQAKRDEFRDIVLKRLMDNSFLNENGKVAPIVLRELSQAGYFGQVVEPELGGLGHSKTDFARTVTNTATVSPVVAGLASIHQCIGAVDPLRAYGTEEQKAKWLPRLASGEKLSAFALTEPGAGSDYMNIKTKAVWSEKEQAYLISGEKLFITNALPGHIVGLVCRYDNPKTGKKDEHAVFIVELPEQEDASFRIKPYGLHALKQTFNNGLEFKDFRVPKENLLDPTRGGTKKGDGMSIAYNGLNAGRLALCANAAGTMRGLLANFPPWIYGRESFGVPLAKHQLVQHKMGKTASRIILAESLRDFCAGLMDKGYRGEMEGIMAKVLGSEAQSEVAIEYFMNVHGGRSFLEGHLFGDNINDFLAPRIYEGSGDLLRMAFMKSAFKEHVTKVVVPLGTGTLKEKVAALGWFAGTTAARALQWIPQKMLSVPMGIADRISQSLRPEAEHLDAHSRYAEAKLQNGWATNLAAMIRYREKLPKENMALIQLGDRYMNLLAMKVVAEWGRAQKDPVIRKATDVMCRDLKRRATGGLETPADGRLAASLGRDVAKGNFSLIQGIPHAPTLQAYQPEEKQGEALQLRVPNLDSWNKQWDATREKKTGAA